MRRILLIESDSSRRARVSFLLRHMGYRVDECADLRENDAEGVGEPDMLVIAEDAVMGELDGTAPWPLAGFAVPKVVLGREREEVAGVPYLELGADVYLPAPLDLRLLLAWVRVLLDRPRGTTGCDTHEGCDVRTELYCSRSGCERSPEE